MVYQIYLDPPKYYSFGYNCYRLFQPQDVCPMSNHENGFFEPYVNIICWIPYSSLTLTSWVEGSPGDDKRGVGVASTFSIGQKYSVAIDDGICIGKCYKLTSIDT